MQTYVVGVDAGGTRTRAVAAAVGGQVLGRADAGPGNPTACGDAIAAGSIVAAIRGAIAGLDPADAKTVVVAAAGGDARLLSSLRHRLRSVPGCREIADRLSLRSDVEAAFAAGTANPSGHILVAGTGAVAAVMVDGQLRRNVDGNGWLLGDAGGGFWIGREAVRAAMAALERDDRQDELLKAVSGALAVPPERLPLLSAVYGEPPVRLARLAPMVLELHGAGNGVAAQIVAAAADALVASVKATDPAGGAPLVLAGGVLVPGTALTERVVAASTANWGLQVSMARDTAAGAAWLGLRESGSDPHIHKVLTSRAEPSTVPAPTSFPTPDATHPTR